MIYRCNTFWCVSSDSDHLKPSRLLHFVFLFDVLQAPSLIVEASVEALALADALLRLLLNLFYS